MLSYQHHYHAGNLADLHKHALLAWVLEYLTGKQKPLSYIETPAGRGLYDLDAPEARKTGEAAAGILRGESALPEDHPYRRAIAATRAAHGPMAYPGSPLIAAHLLRATDSITLAELHPGEYAHLARVMAGSGAKLYHRDGLELARALCPPTPRRGVVMIDPSYEVKDDYTALPRLLADLRRKWNVGVLLLWYPILTSDLHAPMTARLQTDHPDIALHETCFALIRAGHRMVGSGLAVINPPWGMDAEAARLDQVIRGISGG